MAQDAGVKRKNLAGDFEAALGKSHKRGLKLAPLAILAEKTWTRAAPAACLAGLFASASWFGLLQAMPLMAKEASVVLFGAAMVVALAQLRHLTIPTQKDALDRLDRMSGRADRPATLFNDRLTEHSTPEQAEVWQAYRERLSQSIDGFRVGWPQSELPVKDPFALRHLALVLTVAAYCAAPGHHLSRIESAFDWTTPPPPPILPTVEAWLTPPAYTSQPPVSLYNAQRDAVSETKDFTVPAGTVLTINIYKDKTAHVFTEGGAVVPKDKQADLPGTIQNSFQLNSNANVYVEGNGKQAGAHTELRWRFSVIPTVAPTVTVTGAPVPVKGRPDALSFPYSVQSEYGAALGEAQITIQNTRHDPAKPPMPQLVLPPG